MVLAVVTMVVLGAHSRLMDNLRRLAAESINELAEIFKELTVLIVDQGTILDRIDYNLEVALERTKDGVGELTKVSSAFCEQRRACEGRRVACVAWAGGVMLGVVPR